MYLDINVHFKDLFDSLSDIFYDLSDLKMDKKRFNHNRYSFCKEIDSQLYLVTEVSLATVLLHVKEKK